MSSEDRRDAILDAAVIEFARTGLHGTAVEVIAERVGVSQPYVFRLFGTKKELFLAVVERCFDRVKEAFRQAAKSNPEDPGKAMGEAYKGLLSRRHDMLLQLQAYAACDDPEVQRVVARRYLDLFGFAQGLTGCTEGEMQLFFACGMLMTVGAAVGLEGFDKAGQNLAAVFPRAHP